VRNVSRAIAPGRRGHICDAGVQSRGPRRDEERHRRWISAVWSQCVWDGKPAAVVSVSPGTIGGFGANHHLRQSLVFLNMPTLQQPEVYIGSAAKMFDAEGKLLNADTRGFLLKFLDAFAAWIEKVKA
jgi:chromate reductase, NAD(P)H dehydrogenase (quinone)